MSLQLLPGIGWALDQAALEQVRRWQNGLSDKARMVFQVASCWEEFTDIINTYRQQNFDDTMLAAGLGLETQKEGRRINIVVVACFPQEGGLAWTDAEKKIDAIQQQPITLEQHRVLLHPTLLSVQESSAPRELDTTEIASLRSLPWLLTRKVTGGFTLSPEEFHAHFSSLLDALFLAEREGGTVPGHLVGFFFRQPAQPGHVRLTGFSRVPLGLLLQDLAQSLSQTQLAQAARQPYEAAIVHAFEKKLAHWLGEFLAGQRTSAQIEDNIMREARRLQWPVAALLTETQRIFGKEKMRLQREPTADQQKGNVFIRVWQRFRAWCGYPPPAPIHGPDSLQIEALSKNLTKMAEVLEELTRLAQTYARSPAALPPELVNNWSVELHDLIIQRLEKRWSELDVLSRLAWKIEQDLNRHFIAALHGWNIHNKRAQEVADSLAAGNLLRFSASLRGGLPVQVQALVTSLNLGPTIRHGAQNVTCATVRLWSGRPPLLLAASEPVPVEHLLL